MSILTTGSIAERLQAAGYDVTRDRVQYLIRKARLEPQGRAGIVRVFGPEALAVVRRALDAELPVDRHPSVIG